MANKTFQSRIVQKHDTQVNWEKAINFIPLKGEIIVYDDLNKIKIGDGATKINDLSFIASDITGAASTITDNNLNPYYALISDTSGKVATSATSSFELDYVKGVKSNIQDQLDKKLEKATVVVKGTAIKSDDGTQVYNYVIDLDEWYEGMTIVMIPDTTNTNTQPQIKDKTGSVSSVIIRPTSNGGYSYSLGQDEDQFIVKDKPILLEYTTSFGYLPVWIAVEFTIPVAENLVSKNGITGQYLAISEETDMDGNKFITYVDAPSTTIVTWSES